jgi:hypothetical protein
LIYAAERHGERIKLGETLRVDDLFRSMPSGRSAADEIAEGVLLAARNQFEEMKVRHLGYG